MNKVCFALLILMVSMLFRCAESPLSPENASAPSASAPTGVRHVKALVIYAQDADDDYPFPTKDLRRRIFSRVSRYFDVMSYGRHAVEFVELTNSGGYFRGRFTASEYKRQFKDSLNAATHDAAFGLFNEEILRQALDRFGEKRFADVDLIVLVGTDGGPGWYLPNVNAQGFARLGFKFEAAGRTFPADYGGITIEIGSDFTSQLYDEAILYWTFAHEYTHWLGFRKHRSKSAGIYSLMTSRLYADEKYITRLLGPNPLDPLLVMRFGWLDKTDATRVRRIDFSSTEVQVTLEPIRSRSGVVVAQIPLPGTERPAAQGGGAAENFYIVYHRRESNIFDQSYPGSGILIWHTVLDNILDLECAIPLPGRVNRDHLDDGQNMQGLPGDFYNRTTDLAFTPESRPNSNIWGLLNPNMKDVASGVSVSNIHEVDGKVRFTVAVDTSMARRARRRAGSKIPRKVH